MTTTKYTNGTEQTHDDLYDAMDAIRADYPDAVFFDESGFEIVVGNSDAARILVWETEEESINDDGESAIAEILSI